ncbi:hypothetical protein [Dictyobacter arantiisoli]|uniref:Uncharacterized protein n=1 Tax=Dictyobacter arantiisoli TaxID=2014874 RepID=A0A5A5THZ6_9CHLR|nr:hypothetical protein [Dictyobacter arantiisoli]GCF11210.1 hypothetical protein KDI_47740 [Dictyobacter arantiisoli]
MTQFMNADGSGLVGALNPLGNGQALQVDGSGNLKVTPGSGAGIDGGVGAGLTPEVSYLFNSGAPGNNNFDRQRELQGKGIIFNNVTAGSTLGSTSLTFSSVAGLLPGSPVLLVGGGYVEVVYVSNSYVVGSNPVSLQTGLTYASHTGAFWDTYAPQGPQLNGLLATGIEPVANVIIDPNAGNYYIGRAASQDGCSGSNIPLMNAALFNGTSLDRAIGLNGVPSMQNWVRQLALQGHAYLAQSGLQSSGTGTNDYPLSIFNPAASGKTILIYSIRIMAGTAGANSIVARLKFTTTDPAYSGSATVSNLKAGGASSAIAGSCSFATSNTTPVAPFLQIDIANGPLELLQNDQILILPSGSASGLSVFLETYAAGSYCCSVKYVEF